MSTVPFVFSNDEQYHCQLVLTSVLGYVLLIRIEQYGQKLCNYYKLLLQLFSPVVLRHFSQTQPFFTLHNFAEIGPLAHPGNHLAVLCC